MCVKKSNILMQMGNVLMFHLPPEHSAYFSPYRWYPLLQLNRIIRPFIIGITLPFERRGVGQVRVFIRLPVAELEEPPFNLPGLKPYEDSEKCNKI